MELQFFEDLLLGGEWSTRRRTITDADLALFSGLAGDFNPLVVDAEYAATSHLRGRVVPASMLSAVAVGLGSMDVPLPATVGMVGMTWKFLKPVRPGDTVHSRWRLARKRAVQNPTWGLAVWRVELLDQSGEIVAEGDVARLVARRESPATPSGRRRRRGRRAPASPPAAELEPLPEPAPADVPPPSRRRRGRRPAPAEPAAPAAAGAQNSVDQPAPPSASPRRRRRRRPGGGNGNGAGSLPGGGSAGSAAPQPANGTAAEVQSAPDESRSAGAPETASGGEPLQETQPERSLGRMLRRLRGS